MSARPALLIYSNCQGLDLVRLMRSNAAHFGYDCRLLQFHLLDKEPDRLRPDLFENVEVVWEQLGSDFPEYREQMHAMRPAQARTITFPSLNMLSLWPFTGVDSRQEREPLYPGSRYVWQDYVAAAIDPGQETVSDEVLFDRYMQASAEKLPNLERRLAMDIARWRERDSTCDVKIADHLLESFRAHKLFYSYSRPTPYAMREILDQLLAKTIEDTDLLARIGADLDRLLKFYIGYDMEECPVNPLVAKHFELEWCDPDGPHRHYFNAFTFKDYIVRYMRLDPYVRRG